jgi:hypothetical protein
MNDYTMIDVDASGPAAPEVQAVVGQLKAGIEAQFGPMYSAVLGKAPNGLAKRYVERNPERDTPIGNLVTDAFRARTGTDLAITALGLISERLYRGPILGADLFRSLSYGYDVETGFGFRMATFDIAGAELVKGMEIGLSQIEVSDDLFLQYSGLRFSYDPLRPAGERVDVGSIRINHKKWSPTATYSVTVNTGIAMLLGMLDVDVSNLRMRDELEYDVVRDYILGMKTIETSSQGRITEHAGKVRPGASGCGRRAMTAYPNPFNPSTTFSVPLVSDGHVRVTLYNSIGQEVATLADGEFDAGVHEFRWDAGAMPAGVYFCRIAAAGVNETVKVQLLK